MTRLNDYLRAEVPDETEPVTFYRPGGKSWQEQHRKRSTAAEGPPDESNDELDDGVTDLREVAKGTTGDRALTTEG